MMKVNNTHRNTFLWPWVRLLTLWSSGRMSTLCFIPGQCLESIQKQVNSAVIIICKRHLSFTLQNSGKVMVNLIILWEFRYMNCLIWIFSSSFSYNRHFHICGKEYGFALYFFILLEETFSDYP